MTFSNIISHIVGVLAGLAGFAWAGYDAVSNAGRIDATTAGGALCLVLLAGFLIDKDKTAEFVRFVFASKGGGAS